MRNGLSQMVIASLVGATAALCLGPSDLMRIDVTNVRPLAEYATQVEHIFARIVTYEEPIQRQTSFSAMVSSNSVLAARNYGLPERRFAFRMENKPADALSAVRTAVKEFNASQPDRAYEVRESSIGIHLVPVAARTGFGGTFPAESALDLKIAVPVQERTPTAHFEELCAAVSNAARLRIVFDDGSVLRPYLDDFFAGKEKTVTWGTGLATARDALIDLLSRSASSLTWQLRCQPPSGGQAEFCTFSVRSLLADTAGEGQPSKLSLLPYDRCPQCRPVHSLRPPLPPPGQ